MDLPTFSDATESAQQAAQAARGHGRTLIPWLPDPPACERCEAMLWASETYHPFEAAYVTSWHCRECDVHYEREPEYGPAVLEGPSRGSTVLQRLFKS